MADAMTHDEIFEKVQEVLVDALGVDEEEVTPDAKLTADLEAESIDYLDISYRLEKAFGIKIGQNELVPEAVFNDEQYAQDGKVTDAGMAKLREALPFADLAEFDADRRVTEFTNIFTVDTIVQFVQRKLEA